MKNTITCTVLSALLVVAATPAVKATVFFSDAFTNSTLNSASPADPTTTNTAYEMVSSKAWNPTPTMATNDFKMGIGATTAGYFQAEALFATNQVALTQPGDFIELTVVFTDTSGLLTVAGQLGFGLYNSGQVKPVAGGINNTIGNTYSGGAQNWLGYVGAINFTGASSRINTRPAQTATTGLNQDLVSFGTSSSYAGATGVGTATGNLTLTVGATYTELLVIQLNGPSSLAITNTLYSGVGTGGIVLTNFGGIATNATFLTSGFDGLAIGYTGRANTGGAPTIDISSVKVDGSVTIVSGPPTITVQPVDVTVPSGQSCAFSVAAQGFNVTYQWRRHGTNLVNVGNISGATSSQLVISPAGPGDVLSGANGYYCVVTGAGPFSTNTVTNALSLVTAKNLVYSGSGTWDLNNSASWVDAATLSTPLTFNFGDSVRLDDFGAGGTVPLSGTYLSASSVTVSNTVGVYTFSGTGSFAGAGSLYYTGPNQFTINNANTYSGGTLISNATAKLRLGNFGGLGTGPVTLAMAGGQIETLTTGSASVGIAGDLVVADDFTLQVDGMGTFAAVLLGNLSGTPGKVLTINPNAGNSVTNQRVRVYGTNTTYNANLLLNSSLITLAPYLATGTQIYNGIISGDGNVIQRGSATTIFNGNNTYTGGTTPTAGNLGFGIDSTPTVGTVTSGPIGTGPLFIQPEVGSANGSGTVFASGGARTIANPLQYPTSTNNQTLIVSGSNALTFTGPYTLNGNDLGTPATNRVFQVNASNTVITLSGVISDAGQGYGFTKTGAGTLDLNNTETYTGATTVSGGVLAGSGSIPGDLIVATNGAIGGGTAVSMGMFTVGGGLNITNGGGYFRINRAGLVSDVVSVAGALTNSGTLGTITVTNLGAALQLGDKFVLFNKAMSNGTPLTVIGGNVAWGNNLAVDGSIVVVTPPDTGIQLAGPASTPPGNVTNIITVTNIGPGTALNLVITDAVPANTTFVRADSGGTTNGHLGVVVWNLASLAANASTNFTLVINAPAVGTITNIATVVSAAADLAPGNNSATNFVTVASTIVPTVPPHISNFGLAGANVVISGTNGVTGGTYYLLGTTNLVKPLAQWTPVATNVVSTNGVANAFTFTGTNVVIPGAGQQFYILSSTNNR